MIGIDTPRIDHKASTMDPMKSVYCPVISEKRFVLLTTGRTYPMMA